jgi:hypothetical protein
MVEVGDMCRAVDDAACQHRAFESLLRCPNCASLQLGVARHNGGPERLLDVLRKRIDHSALVITLICPEEPAANECVDLAMVKFDRKTAKAGPTPRSATPHSAC